jgi:hypothetical protein
VIEIGSGSQPRAGTATKRSPVAGYARAFRSRSGRAVTRSMRRAAVP